MGVTGSITSLRNPRIKEVMRLRVQRHRRSTGLFIAEGTREVTRAVEAGLKVQDVFFCPSPGFNHTLVNRLIASGGGSEVSREVMSKISYRQNPEGLIAVFEHPRYRLEDLRGDEPCGGWPANRWPGHELWIVAVGTQKPGNLGAITRSAEAAGCRGLLAGGAEVDAFNPNAIRASTGGVFVLPIISGATDSILIFLRDRGVRVVVATPEAPNPHHRADMTGPVALVVAAEDAGVAGVPELNRYNEGNVERVSIPMVSPMVDSLNVSVAAGVLLYEAVRQRSNLVSDDIGS